MNSKKNQNTNKLNKEEGHMKTVINFRDTHRVLKELDIWETAFICYDEEKNEMLLFGEDKDKIFESSILRDKSFPYKVISSFPDVVSYDRMVARIYYDLKMQNKDWAQKIIHEMERRFPYLAKKALSLEISESEIEESEREYYKMIEEELTEELTEE